MLKIRLRRMGKKNRAFYRLVVSDSRKVPTASAVEELGHYDPSVDPPDVRVDHERINYWVSNGATMSATVASLVRRTPAEPAAEEAENAATA